MKLNNKGFAVSTFMYMLLLLAIILILATLAILSSRRMILDRQKNIALQNITKNSDSICKHWENPYSLNVGTKYRCQVKSQKKYNFYILSFNDDDTVNLIMDRNICEDGSLATETNRCIESWYVEETNNIFGPVTAMQKLYNTTKDWTNIPNINLVYDDKLENENFNTEWEDGYTGISINDGLVKITDKNQTEHYIQMEEEKMMKARLPKLSEVISQEVGCTTESASCPDWLVNNLAASGDELAKEKYKSNQNISKIYGYWILTSNSSGSHDARTIRYSGNVSGASTSNSNDYGIRPVITVPKSMLK